MDKISLYLVGTPIGNLGDMTYRAVETLKSVDFIAAEDTRVSIKLLNYFDIKKPLVSYYEHNKHASGEKLLERMKNGEVCALITDAGMPAISDPGADIVKMCIDAGLTVSVIPGACAAVSALAISGIDTTRFVFEGFLSTANKSRLKRLEELATETRTMIFYEAPHKLVKTLSDMLKKWGDRKITLVRELTKIHEQAVYTSFSEALDTYSEAEPRGEFVMIIEGAKEDDGCFWAEMTVEEHLNYYLEGGMSKMDAVKQTAKDRGVPKNDVYKIAHEI